ncbi:MAG: long-chain fatty acid--CoA ligase [Burkholderiales bacterium]|nr:long-chain fatty acid--CoA ligase [Burkholderiales bacterium]
MSETRISARPVSPFWPPGLPRHLTLPQTHLFHNIEVSAARYPHKPAIVYYDSPLSYAQLKADAERLAGHLQHVCGVKRGDRVLLYLQNGPQWVIGYYAILRADAVVVPVNPMNLSDELRHYVHDTGATTAIVPQDLLAQVTPLLATDSSGAGLRHLVVATYSDYLGTPTTLRVPDIVAAPRDAVAGAGLTAWHAVLARGLVPGPMQAGPDDLAVMPYTSGTTGAPKGCMHTHRSVMSTLVGGVQWFGCTQDAVFLSVLPFFHVTGMAGSMNGPLYVGATIVLLTRWDREAAAESIQRYHVTLWQVISTMMIDFLSNPRIEQYDLSSLVAVRGGGAAMPEAIALKLKALTGLSYAEGYGMSETMAATHINPPQRAKPQCLGIPVFDVDARIVDPDTLAEMPQGESGEIVVHGPQVMQGYWHQPQATADSFVQIDGKRFLRTGDLARIDEDGYFFMVDRLKRMINAAGFKVWPAEVEAMMYKHPAILEACVIAARDARRGETVKALVVLKDGEQGRVSEQDIITWAHEHMAAYKSPRIVEFVAALPKSGSGKVQWRELQAQELARSTPPQETR